MREFLACVNISLALALLLRRFFASDVGEEATSSPDFRPCVGLRSLVVAAIWSVVGVEAFGLLSVLMREGVGSASVSFSFLLPKTRLRNPPEEALRSVVPASLKGSKMYA